MLQAPVKVLKGTFNNLKAHKGTFSEYSAITTEVSMSKWGSLLIRRVTLVWCQCVTMSDVTVTCDNVELVTSWSGRTRAAALSRDYKVGARGRNAPPKNWLNAGPSREKRNKGTISVFNESRKSLTLFTKQWHMGNFQFLYLLKWLINTSMFVFLSSRLPF